MSEKIAPKELLELTTTVVSAYVANNAVASGTVGGLIEQVHETLSTVGAKEKEPEKPVPAVPIRRSVQQDYLICLEDGKKLKMLKRHLKTAYGMTPEEYREKWGLPSDYPMVAPSYAEHRSNLAKKIGLGQTPRKGKAEV